MTVTLSLLILVKLIVLKSVATALIECPPSEIASSMRYRMTLTIPGGSTYSGTLLLSSNRNFVLVTAIPETSSPISAIQGVWSSSSCNNTLTLTSHTFYFLDLPKLTIDQVVCSYTCGSLPGVSRSCSVSFTTRKLKATGMYSVPFDLSLPEN